MPARPARLDEISEKLRGAAASAVIAPVCCFKTCERPAVAWLLVTYRDGHGELHGLCKQDLLSVRVQNPEHVLRETPQAMVVF